MRVVPYIKFFQEFGRSCSPSFQHTMSLRWLRTNHDGLPENSHSAPLNIELVEGTLCDADVARFEIIA